MHFTRPRELLIAGLVGLVAALLGFQVGYTSMPRLPSFAGVTLLVLALVELGLGFSVRSRIRAGKVITGLAIARAVTLAKASSLLGALMAGVWAGALGYLLPRLSEITAAADDVPAAGIGAGCAAALIAGALWLEYCCRTPEPRDPDRDRESTG